MRTRAPFLVGRTAEIDEIEHALGRAREGRGGALFLVGEAGIGKSRLTAEAVSRAIAAKMVVLRGRGSTIGPMVPFRPLAEAVLSLVRRGELPSEDELGRYRGVLGTLVPDWAIDQSERRGVSLVALAEAVVRLTSAVGRDRGCLLVLEDLHDVDVETLAVIEYLIDNLDDQSTLLLGTMRAEAVDAVELVRRQDGTIIDLDRLREPDVVELIGACLSAAPADVPPPAVELLWHRSAGNPLLVEELLHGMVTSGHLARGPGGWRLDERIRVEIPATVRRSVALRTDRLADDGRTLLWAGAVLGPRFPLSVVQRIVEMDDRVLFGQLHMLVEAQLLAPDERGPDWYAFQHPLIAEAMLDQLTPADRITFSRRAGAAIEHSYPGLPGEWCQLAATLWLAAGEPAKAARLFTDAGRRALADGAAGSAISLLERAEHLLTEHPDPYARAEVLEALLYALTEAGELERAFELAGTLGRDESGLDAARRVAVRVRLAWGAYLAGRWDDGMAQVAEARTILGERPAPGSVAAIDAVAAHLALDMPGRERLAEVEALARSALAAAGGDSHPVESCQALMAIGVVSRERDLAESIAWFERMAVVARTHRLPIWHLYARSGAATSTWLGEGDVNALRTTGADAERTGVVNVGSSMDAVRALHLVMCGRFAEAAVLLGECLARVRRLHLEPVERYLLMARTVLHAHQGNRPDLEASFAEFRDRGGDRSRELPLALGMGRAFCALLEDDTDLARRELDAVVTSQRENPTTFYLAGKHGLLPLLVSLDAKIGSDEHREFTELGSVAVATMRWNRQFVDLGRAVLLGREGKVGDAEAAWERARRAGRLYPVAWHLGLRLVAGHAHQDGWGEPAAWLRQAEEYFHRAAVPALAGACRVLLRQVGASAPQRQSAAVPVWLRARGITMREFEVLELLVARYGNREIATLLHISHRTVEKHVANLLAKTDQPNRAALIAFAAH